MNDSVCSETLLWCIMTNLAVCSHSGHCQLNKLVKQVLLGEKKNATECCKIGINKVKQQIQNEHELIWDL